MLYSLLFLSVVLAVSWILLSVMSLVLIALQSLLQPQKVIFLPLYFVGVRGMCVGLTLYHCHSQRAQ
jgi:hypothetical protein